MWMISRLMVILMAGVVCFSLLVPLALRNHQTGLAVFVSVVFVAYACANVYFWRRMKSRL